MTRRQPRTVVSQMQRAVRVAEADARADNVQDVGTGFTIIKLHRHQPPLRSLVESGKISAVELQAAEEISLAVTAVSSRGLLSAVLLERIDHGRSDKDWPAHVALAVRNYQRWAIYWTTRWNQSRNRMFSVIWDAVIEERPISVIADDHGFSRHFARRAIVCGLRHYAARAGMVTGKEAYAWLEDAQGLGFKTVVPTRS